MPLDAPTETRADRLHAAISTTLDGFYSAVDEASFERRAGHVRLLFRSVPVPIFNGALVEAEPSTGIADSIREVEERGLPCGVQVRAARHPDVEEKVVRLGLTARVPMPGMTVSPDELADARAPGLEIVRVEDEEGLADAARVAAAGGGAPLEFMLALYAPGLLQLAGLAVYLGRVDGETVTTGIGYQTDKDVAIFSVATPPEHRRRGYGGAITAHAARAAFENGADVAWLQTSKIGESVYRGLGFRQVEMHFMLGRPSPQRSWAPLSDSIGSKSKSNPQCRGPSAATAWGEASCALRGRPSTATASPTARSVLTRGSPLRSSTSSTMSGLQT